MLTGIVFGAKMFLDEKAYVRDGEKKVEFFHNFIYPGGWAFLVFFFGKKTNVSSENFLNGFSFPLKFDS